MPDLLKNARALSADDVVRVLQASRAAVAGKSLRLTPALGTAGGPEILMSADGRMAVVRTVTGTSRRPPNEEPAQMILTTTLTVYTRQPARYCDGTPATGELVVDYTSSVGGATVIARRTSLGGEPLSTIFEILSGSLTATDAGRKLLANRWARGFKAPWNPPASDVEQLPDGRVTRFQRLGPQTEMVAMFWIDEASLEPVRFEFEITVPESARRDSPGLPNTMPYGFRVQYRRQPRFPPS